MTKELEGRQGLKPERELLTLDGYRWFVYGEEATGLRLVCLEDIETGIVVSTPLANPDVRVAAHKAWSGARQSRAPGTPWEIRQEMGMKGVDPDAKLEETFRGYGHRSVGDMARIQVDFTRVPMHLPFVFFNLGDTNSGQEKSTRYQPKFDRGTLHSIRHYLPEAVPETEIVRLEEEYQRLGELSLALFAKYRDEITAGFQAFYKPDSNQQGSLNSRVLDCVRYFLLFGQASGFAFETSARDWSRIISQLKASPVLVYGKVGKQIERLLVPTKDEEGYLGYRAEAPGLIRHTGADITTRENLFALRGFLGAKTGLLQAVQINRRFRGWVEQSVGLIADKYTEGEKIVAQYILTIWPGLDRKTLFEWVHAQNSGVKAEISRIIFSGHNNYKEMPLLARVTGISLVFESFLGEDRDFNRHRAWGRFTPLPLVHGLPIDRDTVRQILARGFGLPLYLTCVPEFARLRERFRGGLLQYYADLYDFFRKAERYDFADYSFMVNLLPLAHQVDIWMHGDPKQVLYFTHQRTRPGGHINYRDLAWRANQLIADSDPYLCGMRLGERPNPASREEFFDRS